MTVRVHLREARPTITLTGITRIEAPAGGQLKAFDERASLPVLLVDSGSWLGYEILPPTEKP